jgi:hypothetical protein
MLSPAAAFASDVPVAAVPSAVDRPAGHSFEINGKIESIDYAENVMVVKSRGTSLTIAITPTTSVERDGEPGGISDLRPGVRVRVSGSQRDGVMTAESITIKGPDSSR